MTATKHVIFSMIEAIPVQFIKSIFEDDFIEKGMRAWLTDIEWNSKAECYELFFDFTEFEDYNLKYFKRSYYANICTQEKVKLGEIPESKMYTAIEAGCYCSKYSVFFSVSDDSRDDALFAREIADYLRVMEQNHE